MRVCEGSGIAPLVCTKQSIGPLLVLKRFQCQPKLRSRGEQSAIFREGTIPHRPSFLRIALRTLKLTFCW
ncbi:hypothetical protein GDO78_003557 [Eleutherodactylus coqui]|uniref:Uncharacterized protein n=1 Tax=Eleutherodactylus coqui TaxID=57060 RepID=A0A8J6EUF8_ELECQ|nr:hypothetical protein GDO78_003557 [Eleutherodactylus coqui]